jgi:hypothetical protein
MTTFICLFLAFIFVYMAISLGCGPGMYVLLLSLCDKMIPNVLAMTDRSKEQQAGVAGPEQCIFSGRIKQLAGKAEYPS